MRFRQIDRIVELQLGYHIRAERTLRADEEFLKDHFPHFPVMPGVLMLESLFQAGLWLVRVSDDFRWPLVLLHEVKSVKFADFLTPGDILDIDADWIKTDGSRVTLKAQGRKRNSDRACVSARLVIDRRELPRDPRPSTNEELSNFVRAQFESFFGPLSTIVTPVGN